MSTESTKQWLKDIAAGKVSLEAVDPSEDILYDLCTSIELQWIIDKTEKYGTDVESEWPKDDQLFFKKLSVDIPNRLAPDYFVNKRFYYKRLPGELLVIRYKDSKKNMYQLFVGYEKTSNENITYNVPNEIIKHSNLNEWEPGIDFDKIVVTELPTVAGIIEKESKGLERSHDDQKFIDYLVTDTNKRIKINEKYDCLKGVTSYIIHYSDGSIRIEKL
jgi:hypothetical protein